MQNLWPWDILFFHWITVLFALPCGSVWGHFWAHQCSVLWELHSCTRVLLSQWIYLSYAKQFMHCWSILCRWERRKCNLLPRVGLHRGGAEYAATVFLECEHTGGEWGSISQ